MPFSGFLTPNAKSAVTHSDPTRPRMYPAQTFSYNMPHDDAHTVSQTPSPPKPDSGSSWISLAPRARLCIQDSAHKNILLVLVDKIRVPRWTILIVP